MGSEMCIRDRGVNQHLLPSVRASQRVTPGVYGHLVLKKDLVPFQFKLLLLKKMLDLRGSYRFLSAERITILVDFSKQRWTQSTA